MLLSSTITSTHPLPNNEHAKTIGYEQFLTEYQDVHAEWVNGQVMVFMSTTYQHQLLLTFLLSLLDLYVRAFQLGNILAAPFQMKLAQSGREPDLLFISNETAQRLTERKLEGAADLVIEIISPESVRRDRYEKFDEYEEAGVREYWIIDPRPGKQRADFYVLDEHRRFALFATEDDEQVNSHVLPGFWLRPAWLWEAEKLSPLTCALQIPDMRALLLKQLS